MTIYQNTSKKPANRLPKLERRQLLLGAGWGVAALLLAGCGTAPRRATHATAPRPMAGRRAGGMVPHLPVGSPLLLAANQREEAVARAMLAINAPYRYGGNSLETGFDCSGLVQYVFSGLSAHLLPRSTIQWARASQPIDEGMLQRGDLVFFNTLGTFCMEKHSFRI